MIISKRKYIIAKKFQKSSLNRNFWAFLFFLVLSAGFWLFLTLDEDYDVDIDIPVSLVNVPSNVVITTPPPPTIKITLHDRGAALLRYKYSDPLDTIRLDFDDYNKLSGHVSLLTANIARNVTGMFSGNTRVVGFKPDTVEYYYNFGDYVKVPIRINGNITADSLYSLSDTTITPRYAKVYASREILDTLTAVYTRTVRVEKLNRKESLVAKITPIRGAKIVPDKVKLSFDADLMTENTVRVPIEHINFPADKTLKTFPGIVSVTFNVGMKHYREVTADKFAIVVTYDNAMQSRNNRLRITLKDKPAGVSHIRIIPEEVDFLIEDLSEK